MPGTKTENNGLRVSEGALALITCRFGNDDCWFARWNRHWAKYSFVGGHRHDNESFRDCIVRELEEELALRSGDDYRLVDSEPIARLSYEAWSRSARCDTLYRMELFGVVLNGNAAGLSTKRPVRWLTRAEIEALQAGDGRQVSETMRRILEQIHWRVLPGA
ncbi:MAG: NUDIX domain-containing protein [Lentisphaerae bacterium]|nr:NUDIX domain-containing protein [Lentisphaerota bacterium]